MPNVRGDSRDHGVLTMAQQSALSLFRIATTTQLRGL
jgi:hypothetical protein